ncbi:hypothetical protein NYR77_03600 [Actinobacillus equuli subsp. haemolyticus]|uniref:hypothetical protein n=1 Tax=Actinobacillus equuli TaxID=718 RepID=UPI0024418552|nr:hypothetical protein [Actinobacillus equuli]WGE42797.1 hypothetical protein NYR64_02835 [Actinobacillus equuli subsp. haemolyticus]WGE59711.1 hypothetical protein NYR73_02910 [Actinobacillus equuli subsp. haemolyticus]WGE61648.1 hypothetical protein NYR74_02560 [Actinobacillus equuli subsp. haemolyticus]WGE64044.1 hypothetical protein NYR75_04255 [Actinobacillus equuli subsp. haemolyticus]WGE68127.1 hypothetical protein NYR77_03600 [Actinobacillus equuli subsp. haemolyticus]
MKNIEKWENRELGQDEKFVQRSTHTTPEMLDELLALQPISIRLSKGLIQDLKDIAQLHGLGYQPLIKQILTRFVESEKRMLANEKIQEDLAKLHNAA